MISFALFRRRVLPVLAAFGVLAWAWWFSFNGRFHPDRQTPATRLTFPDTLNHSFPWAPVSLFRFLESDTLYLSSGPPETVVQEKIGRIWQFQNNPAALKTVSISQVSAPKYQRLSNLVVEKNCVFEVEGACDLPELRLRLELSFEGIRVSKPTYVVVNMSGGRTGWQSQPAYFGKRVLTMRDLDTGALRGRFIQRLWNTAGYDPLPDVLWVESSTRLLFVFSSAFAFFHPFYVLGLPVNPEA